MLQNVHSVEIIVINQFCRALRWASGCQDYVPSNGGFPGFRCYTARFQPLRVTLRLVFRHCLSHLDGLPGLACHTPTGCQALRMLVVALMGLRCSLTLAASLSIPLTLVLLRCQAYKLCGCSTGCFTLKLFCRSRKYSMSFSSLVYRILASVLTSSCMFLARGDCD